MKKLYLSLGLCLLASCTAKLSGQITLDGNPFSPTACRSGQANGFHGVDLIGKDNARLRLVQHPSSQAEVYVFAPNSDTGIYLGLCGPMSMKQQNSRINDIHNQEGKATLDCSREGHKVVGSISFENCH